MPNEIPGINMLVAIGGTAVIAQSNATLTTTPELAEAIVKATNFTKQVSGDQEWALSYEGQITTQAGKHALANGNAGLKVGDESDITGVDTANDTFSLADDRSSDWTSGDTVRVLGSTVHDQAYEIDTISGTDVTVVESLTDDTADGAMFKPTQVPGIQTLTLGLEQELNEVPPGVNQATGWKSYVPLRRSWSAELEGHYYDPTDEDVYATIHTARDNGNNLAAALDVMGGTFVGYIGADGMDIEAGTDDNAAYSLTWQGSGEAEKFGTFESTIGSIIDLWINQSTATAALRHEEDGSTVTGSTIWTGSALINSIEMEVARNEFPGLSAEFQGDGQLSRNTS